MHDFVVSPKCCRQLPDVRHVVGDHVGASHNGQVNNGAVDYVARIRLPQRSTCAMGRGLVESDDFEAGEESAQLYLPQRTTDLCDDGRGDGVVPPR